MEDAKFKFTLKEIEGYKSMRALNAFNTLLLGVRMLPMYAAEPYETFYERVKEMPVNDQQTLVREAAMFVELNEEEVQALVSFAADANGAAFGPAQLKSMKPAQILEIIVAVCMEIAKMKIDLVSDREKKN